MNLFEFFFPKDKIITLDVGSKYIKAAHFTMSGKQPVLTHFEMTPCPSKAMEKGVLTEGAVIHEPLKELLIKKLKWNSRKKLFLSAPGSIVLTKIINVPKSEEEVMSEHIKYEASQYLPYNVEEANYNYIELSGLSKDPNMQTYFFVAVKKKSIGLYSSCLFNIQVKPEAIDTEFFALQRVFARNQSKKHILKTENILILDVGFQTVGFYVLRGSQVIFSRNLLSGLQSYLMEIQNSLGLSSYESQSLLNTACKGNDIPDDVIKVIQNYHSTFCREISMGKEYFLNYFPDEELSKCCITGGGADLPELQTELSRRLEMKIKQLEIFRNIQTRGFSRKKLKEIQAFSGVCIGLALRFLYKEKG